MIMTIVEKGSHFRSLHEADELFIMANAWDVGSARILAAEGFPAIGTTSAGVAFCQGLPDYEYIIPRDEMLSIYGDIARSIDLPVSGDLEAGYGESPEAVADTIALSIAKGMVGGSIEDYTGDPGNPLYKIEQAVERIKAARAAADQSGVPYSLTARAECYLVGHDDPYAEAVRRCNLYREAGADCLFVPGIKDAQTIGRMVKDIDGPFSVVMGLSGSDLTVAQLADLGVKRVSVGGSIARAAFAAIRNAAHEVKRSGSFNYANSAIPDAELCKFFGSWQTDD